MCIKSPLHLGVVQGWVYFLVRVPRDEEESRGALMNLGRTETALAKASAVIEQVDVNTLKVVATFPSQSEAERQTGIPRTNIRRGLRQGCPLGGCFWRSVQL
jgi:hypothetical protein